MTDLVIRPLTLDDGFAAYRWDGGNLWVERVHARTPQTLRALWSVIASPCTTADTVGGYPDPNDPFWRLTIERDAEVTRRAMWMLRVVDARRPSPLGASRRVYPSACRCGSTTTPAPATPAAGSCRSSTARAVLSRTVQRLPRPSHLVRGA